MNKAHSLKNWENYPSINTPLNAQNLNELDVSVDAIDDRVITLDTTKFNKTDAQSLIKNITFDLQTGILTKYYYNGSTEEINTGISKLNMNLRFDEENQILYIVNADGTEDPIDLSAFITNYEFNDSDTIAHNVSSSGTVTSIVKEGSIQEKHLRANYLADIKVEVAKAQSSQQAAADSEANAKASENAAKASQQAAATSEKNAKTSETNAKTFETNASNFATKAESYAVGGTNSRTGEDTDNAKYYSQQASASANSASTSASTATAKASQAVSSATNAANSATTATNKASLASTSASQAATSATQSKNYAVGNTNSAKYYYEQAKGISEGLSGALKPIGTVTFVNLPALSDATAGDMYNVSDQFITTSDFKEGIGNTIPAGANVYKTSDGYWDVLAGSPVTGVKGNAESTYRRGNVNITPGNIGAVNKSGDTMTGTLNSSKKTGSYLAGNQGAAIINSTALAGSYVMLDKLNSTNGYFTDGVFCGSRLLQYTAKATVDADTNAVTKKAILLDESGNTSFPGTVSAHNFSGNASSANKATQDSDGNQINTTYLKKTGDSKDNTATFTSEDNANPTAWTNAPVLASGEKHSSIFNKASTMFKNLRYLYKMLGTTDISNIGGGTVTGAISELNTGLKDKFWNNALHVRYIDGISVLQFFNQCSEGITPIATSERTIDAPDLYSMGFILKRSNDVGSILLLGSYIPGIHYGVVDGGVLKWSTISLT